LLVMPRSDGPHDADDDNLLGREGVSQRVMQAQNSDRSTFTGTRTGSDERARLY
jgi:hypothetical protein